jgi:hypothetical protein
MTATVPHPNENRYISKQILLFVKSTEKRFDLEDIDVLSFL